MEYLGLDVARYVRQERMQTLVEAGYRKKDGWDNRCPRPPQQDRFTWEDHIYMLKHSERETIYVSEPYDLDGDDFGEMAKLGDDGWDVRIVPHKSLWNPGSTIPIWISRSGPVVLELE